MRHFLCALSFAFVGSVAFAQTTPQFPIQADPNDMDIVDKLTLGSYAQASVLKNPAVISLIKQQESIEEMIKDEASKTASFPNARLKFDNQLQGVWAQMAALSVAPVQMTPDQFLEAAEMAGVFCGISFTKVEKTNFVRVDRYGYKLGYFDLSPANNTMVPQFIARLERFPHAEEAMLQITAGHGEVSVQAREEKLSLKLTGLSPQIVRPGLIAWIQNYTAGKKALAPYLQPVETDPELRFEISCGAL